MRSDSPIGLVPRGWKVTSLGEVTRRAGGHIQTGPFGSQLHASDYVEVGIPSIMPANIGDGCIITDGIARVAEADAKRLSRHRVVVGDIVYSRRGDVERHALVQNGQGGWLCGTGCIKINLGEGVVVPRYASYYLRHPTTRAWVSRHAVGATMPNLNTSIMSEVPFVLPPLNVQRRIANILGKLDDKIELNRRMNRTLEKMAAAIFKSWFIDFDPVRAKAEGRDPNLPAEIADLFPDTFEDSDLGPIPKGWDVGPLSDLAELKTKAVKPGGEPETLWDHYSIPAYDEGQQPKRELGKTIKSGKYLVPERCVLVSKLNPQFPRIWLPWVTDPSLAICSTEFMPFVARRKEWRPFVYELMRSRTIQDSIQAHVSGSTGSRQRVKPKDIAELSVLTPRENLIEASSAILAPLHERTLANRRQNHCLARLRDALLPRLLSGNLHIPGAEKPAEIVP